MTELPAALRMQAAGIAAAELQGPCQPTTPCARRGQTYSQGRRLEAANRAQPLRQAHCSAWPAKSVPLVRLTRNRCSPHLQEGRLVPHCCQPALTQPDDAALGALRLLDRRKGHLLWQSAGMGRYCWARPKWQPHAENGSLQPFLLPSHRHPCPACPQARPRHATKTHWHAPPAACPSQLSNRFASLLACLQLWVQVPRCLDLLRQPQGQEGVQLQQARQRQPAHFGQQPLIHLGTAAAATV